MTPATRSPASMPSAPTHPRAGLRVLILAEAMTLAHVTRPVALARGLDPSHEVILAAHPRYDAALGPLPWRRLELDSQPAEAFQAALRSGRPLFSHATLRRYVQEDLRLLERVAPDVVVGDLRLSLAVSARLAGVPYAAITNAYWAPEARLGTPVPEHALTHLLRGAWARAVFRRVTSGVMATHTLPLNAVRREFGLPSLGWDLRRHYTCADRTLFADVPQLVPCGPLPDTSRFVGPALWEPEHGPAWSPPAASSRPLIYVTLGSSGDPRLLSGVLAALGQLDATLAVATAGQRVDLRAPADAVIAPFLPGRQVARRASLVVCNGGSPTAWQALAEGTPVLCLPSNMDQHLASRCVEAAGAGVVLRCEDLRPSALLAAARRLLRDPAYTAAAGEVARQLASYDAPRRFAAELEDLSRGARARLARS